MLRRVSIVNWKMLVRVLGWLLLIEAIFMGFPLLASAIYREPIMPFVTAILITLGVGLFATFCVKPHRYDMGKREGFLLTALVLFLAGGYKLRYIITFCAFLIVPALCFLFSESYRVKRIASFIFPDLDPSGLNWQINMSLAAIREGGIFGKGLGNGY